MTNPITSTSTTDEDARDADPHRIAACKLSVGLL